MNCFRSENAQLKQLRKQQEAALAEALQQKGEVLKWIAAEKLKVEKQCEEQLQAAQKDRRAAGKVLREARDKAAASGSPGGGGLRQQQQQLDALMATVEKQRLDADMAAKKHRTALTLATTTTSNVCY
jgi:hypothetical protein